MTDPQVDAADTVTPRDIFVDGICDLCGQELILTDDDCWHPWNVTKACPPEPPGRSPEYSAWLHAGNRSLRPGREHWRPAEGLPDEETGA